MKVEVQFKKLVKPSELAPHHCEKLKLSYIDELQTPRYVGVIFYYKHNAETVGSDVSQRLRRMEESLSKTLTIFYPFAGRYIEDGHGNFIHCNDEGVEFVVTNVDGQINQLIQRQPDVDLLNRLSDFPSKIYGNPLVTVQVNVFVCGGLAIGLWFTHKLGDMYTMAMFMKSWATNCQGNTLEVIHPNFTLPSILPVRKPLSLQWPVLGKYKSIMLMNRFVFDNGTISKMKSLIQSKSLAPSRLEVVSALICQTLIKIDEKRHGKLKPFVALMMTMNLREKVHIPVPPNACGNLYAMVTAKSESKLELEELVTWIGDMLRNAKTRYALANGEELCLMAKDSMADFLNHAAAVEANLIPFSSWCRFPLYENDFGWGKPTLVSPAPPPFKSIYLTDTNVNGGIDAWITLDKDEMTLFKQDPNILALTSNFLVDEDVA